MKLQLGIEKEVDLIIGFKSTSFVLCAFFILLHFVLLEKITFRFIGPLHFVLPDLPDTADTRYTNQQKSRKAMCPCGISYCNGKSILFICPRCFLLTEAV